MHAGRRHAGRSLRHIHVNKSDVPEAAIQEAVRSVQGVCCP